MFTKYPLVMRTVCFVLIPIFLLLWIGYQGYVVEALPTVSGEVRVNGLKQETNITRDSSGVVHIKAQTDSDVYFAMGYAHAQDRLWQLEIQRRLSQGRLSEIFGRSALQQDIWIRTLGLQSSVKESLSHLSDEAIASLDAYAAGINAWLESAHQLPIEFSIMGIQPELWKKEDSLIWVKMFALSLASSYIDEIQGYIGTQYLENEQFQTFFPNIFRNGKVTQLNEGSQATEPFQQLFSLVKGIEQEYKIGGRYVGSNAWVVSGNKTISGAPILANDPHLGLQIPSLWYAVSQTGNKLKVSGMSLVGVPVIIFGKNEHIAWGGTSMMADVQDLYFEQSNPAVPNQYNSKGEWKEFKTRIEQIKIKAEFPSSLRAEIKPIEIQVRESEHGPIISDVYEGFEQPVAMRWTALDKDDTTYESFYRLSYSRDWQSFKAALSLHVAPTLNLFYADVENNIGFMGAGRIPLRKSGNGAIPVYGGDPETDWNGYIPFSQMPQSFNPESGYIVNANNKNTSEDYPYFISQNFALPARAERIEQMLAEKFNNDLKLSLKDNQKMQADVKDLSVQKLLRIFQDFQSDFPQQQAALNKIKYWSGEASAESVGATIYYSWLRHLKSQIFADELQAHWNREAHARYLSAMLTIISADSIAELIEKDSVWCNNVNTQVTENCTDVLKESLKKMLKQTSKLAGDDVDTWKWGDFQNTIYAHTPFSEIKILSNLFERKISNGGSENTVNVSTGVFRATEGFRSQFGAGFRQIIQLQPNNPQHIFMNSTGQSGQLASPLYDNMVESFRDVEYFEFNEVDDSKQVLQLKPMVIKGADQ